LFSVVQEAYVHGVSTRKVEELVQALGVSGMDKSRVSRMCAELDELVEEWRHRRLEKACPYVMLDGKSVRVREGGRVVNKAVLVAYGIQEDGYRSVLGLDVSCVESTATWRSFLRGLKERGLRGVKLVISDDHEGLKAAVAEVFTGSSWQRCVVHFMRNLEGHVAKKDRDALRAIIRSILKQESKERARERLREAAEALGRTKVAELLLEAEEDILAHMSFPASHWKQLRSTNPLERLNREIARRVRVVGIFPTDRSVLRLVGSLLMEQDEEWQLGRRYMSLESMAQVMASEPKGLLVGA
jgi:transposase-like protein